MTSKEFCYWLQGFFEIGCNHVPNSKLELSESQIQIIRDHLNMVFKHEIDPSYGSPEHQAELSHLHNNNPDPNALRPRC